MQKLCNLVLLLCLSIGAYAQDKQKLLCELLTQAENFDQIAPVLDIVKSVPEVYTYIPSIHPIKASDKPMISSSFGNRRHPIDKVVKFHRGIDFVSDFAVSVHATAYGVVSFAGIKSGYGKCVIIRHKFGFETLYGHLTAYYTRTGRKVRRGEIIGFLGNTGKSTGAHLHYELLKNQRVINPEDFLQ